jgi:hypothetical protein
MENLHGSSFTESIYLLPVTQLYLHELNQLSSTVSQFQWPEILDEQAKIQLAAVNILYQHISSLELIDQYQKQAWKDAVAKKIITEAPFAVALEFVANQYEPNGRGNSAVVDESLLKLFSETWGHTDLEYQAIENRLPSLIKLAIRHNPIATINFTLNGEKKIMLNYAKLRIVPEDVS